MIQNVQQIKIDNIHRILSYARGVDSFSKREIAEALHLSFATASTLVNLLEDHRAAEDIPALPAPGAGRSAKRYRLRKERFHFLVLSFSNNFLLTLALIDLDWNIAARVDFPLTQDWTSRILFAYHRLLSVAHVQNEDVVALSVSIQGSYDAKNDILHSPNQSLTDRLPLRATLKALLGKEAIIQNDVDIAATFTAHRTRRDNLLYLYLGWQIGAGVVADGRLLNGIRGRTVEVSHIPMDDPSAIPCPLCGARGCVHTVLSRGAILGRWRGRPLPPRSTGHEAEWQDFIHAVERRDARAMEIVQSRSELLASLMITLFSVCAVADAAISGIPRALYDAMMPAILARLQRWNRVPEPCRIFFDPDAEKTLLIGAMDAAFRRWYPDFENGVLWTSAQKGRTPPQ